MTPIVLGAYYRVRFSDGTYVVRVDEPASSSRSYYQGAIFNHPEFTSDDKYIVTGYVVQARGQQLGTLEVALYE